MAELNLKAKMILNTEESLEFMETAAKIIQNHKSDLSREEIQTYEQAVDRFTEHGFEIEVKK
ncbi:hypothetical protein J5S49_13545 [Virgibacillus halodenitrificans]|uniref:hypothetical protein n=1 Tax=Virgibacillus halodenitrificans TaxID=1482 RepID=UPI001F3EB4EC|nr:hypothetical protein [Virgibacillus halodenitrificans]MCG1029316.1 hypothetical protein [Virgibacillus halodenitrificans]